MAEIHQLPKQVINQIAAGEVVERPASVLKELIENAIDADATAIDITLVNGGIDLIEVRDNGKGISEEDLPSVFSRYATSKIASIEDLQLLDTYGFRGEALASIGSVSTTTVISNRNGNALQISSTNDTLSGITPASRGQGTTIRVEHLFETLPARQKFMKTADTEYKYCLEIINHFVLLNGTIHFSVTHNDKTIYTFAPSEEREFPVERVATIFKIDKNDILRISHEEYGIKISGILLHPKMYSSQSKFLLTYVNGRPIDDKGIFRAVQQGIAGYTPDTFKASAIVSVNLSGDQVDINVHPRKREVRFLNPFRVYSAVTHAVSSSLQQNIAQPAQKIGQSAAVSDVAQRVTSMWERKEAQAYQRLRGNPQSSFFEDAAKQWVHDTPVSEMATDVISDPYEKQEVTRIPEYVVEQSRLQLREATIIPVLGRYIIVAFLDEIWIVDQHAAAERIRFEQFRKAYLSGLKITQQTLLTPVQVFLPETHLIIAKQQIKLLKQLGFDVLVTDTGLSVTAVPTSLQKADIQALVSDTVAEMVDHEKVLSEPSIGEYATNNDLSLIVATMACHNSVRMNQRISTIEAQSIMKDLLQCEIPYACPHGRRVVWRLSPEEIDKQFMRT